MKKITSLTEEQKSRFGEWRDKWIAIGLCTDPMDFEKFSRGAKKCYEKTGLKTDIPIIRVNSPMVGAIASSIADQLINTLVKNKGSAVDSAVDSAVGSAVGSAVDSGKIKSWHYWMGGQMWPYWQSFVTFFTDVCGWEPDRDIQERITAYRETTESACYWWPNKYFIMVCERPIRIDRDDNSRLHSENRKAIEWPDGWGLWMWHGTRVTEKIILHPELITKEDIEEETNSEVSRAIAERLGWEEYLKRADTVLVDKWFDVNTSCHYELYDFNKRFDLTPRMLKMESPEILDGTRPHYIEPVHPDLKSCEAARKWQFLKVD